MPDREKVIKGLECCTRYEVGKQLNNCWDCPYVEPIGFNQFRCKSQEMKEDALALLKEQEGAEPKVSCTEQRCGNCNKIIEMDGWKACPWCGKMIDWGRWWNKNGTHDNA